MNFKWSPKTQPYATGEDLYLGKWRVGSYYYDSMKGQNEKDKYSVDMMLPGIRNHQGSFAKIADAKAMAEKVVKYWFVNADLA